MLDGAQAAVSDPAAHSALVGTREFGHLTDLEQRGHIAELIG
jgi:hypothetical protein